jgi:hypothetical protein
MERHNAEGWGVYIGANPRRERGKRAEHVSLARCLFADFDDTTDAAAALVRVDAAGLPRPSVIVRSGHGVHAYWRLAEPITELTRWGECQRGIIRALGTDKAIHDPPRVMRLPGFRNHKPPAADAVLIDADSMSRPALTSFGTPPAPQPGTHPGTHPGTPPSLARLSKRTRDFLEQGAREGTRNSRLFAAAADFAGCGFGQQEAAERLLGAALGSGLGEEEARGVVMNAYCKPRTPSVLTSPSASAEWQPPLPLTRDRSPPPFPLARAFPPGLAAIRDYVDALAEAYQVPVDLPAMLLPPLLAVSIAQKAEVEAREGWREVSALWTLTLMESGERKSAVFAECTRPILDWEHEESKRLGPLIAEQRERRAIAEARQTQHRRKAGSDAGDSQEAEAAALRLAQELAAEPTLSAPTILASDATTEALAALLIQNHERAIVASPEADALDVMLGRYSEKASPNMGIWLKGHAGDAERVVRRGREPECLRRPSLSVALALQPESVRGLFTSREARGRGLLGRFLVAAPRSLVGRRKTGGTATPVAPALTARCAETIHRLLTLPIDAERGPLRVRLAENARELFHEFEARVERDLAADGSLCDRKDWGGKLCGAILRLALMLHGAEAWGVNHRPLLDAPLIALETMDAALAWAPYLIEHEQIVAEIVQSDPEEGTAHRLLRWLERTGAARFTRRDAFDRLRGGRLVRVDDIDPALSLLQKCGYIRPDSGSAPAGPGRPPSPAFAVSPLWRRPGTP